MELPGEGACPDPTLAKPVKALVLGGKMGKEEPDKDELGLALNKLALRPDDCADNNQSGSFGREVGLGGMTPGTEEALYWLLDE